MDRTAAEAKTEHIERMGLELGELYNALWQELAWVNMKWAEYIALFGTNESRIALMNQAAPRFFVMIGNSLWEDVLLHLSRLTDAPRTAGRDNLSVQRLRAIASPDGEAAHLAALIDVAVVAADFARDWRNRRLAHKDLHLALGREVQPLAPGSRQAVKGALRALANVLNAVSSVHLDSTTIFESDDASAASLLYVLRDGLQYQAERLRRIKSGDARPQDSLKLDPL